MEPGNASRTADRVAQRRAAHQLLDRPVVFADPRAFDVLTPEAAQRIRESPGDPSVTGRALRAFLAARSRFAEDTLAAAYAAGTRQYVLLGAGFDTFAYRNPHPALHVYELDHPDTQAEKRRRIAAPANVTYVPVDLATTSVRDALAASTFDANAPAVFAWLGVVPYLERDAVEATLRDVASCASGTQLVFDYGLPRHALPLLTRLAFDRLAARVAAAGEPWKSFFTPDEMRELLQRCGFTDIEDLDGDAINARWFANRADGLRVGGAGRLAAARNGSATR